MEDIKEVKEKDIVENILRESIILTLIDGEVVELSGKNIKLIESLK